jgi:signal transduction histidine kinase
VTRRPRRLLLKFLLILAPVFVLATLPGVWVMVDRELRQDQELLAARVGNHAARVALALERHFVAGHEAAARDFLGLLAVDRAFVCAELVGRAGGDALLTHPRGLPCTGRADGQLLKIAVGEDGDLTLCVRYTDAELKEARFRQLSIAMVIVAVAFVVALLASAVGFRLIVGRPLGLLLSSIRETARTGERTPVPARGNDEMTAVIRAFNEMSAMEVERETSLRDANARLRASDAELRAANEGLEQRVGERTAELKAALDLADEANRAKSRFLATMSHELRTPLNAIIGFSQFMTQEALGPLGDPRYREFSTDIHSSGHHLLRLINDILDISKIESGAATLDEGRVGLRDLADECRRMIRPLADAKSIVLDCDGAAVDIEIVADRTKLKQVLINILNNAVKFTPAEGRVTFAAVANAEKGVVLTVSDTGIGMSAEEIPRALEPFTQLDSALSRTQEGTGLGLPLAKMLAELHGGFLDVRSAPGKGTTVTVRLPAERLVVPGVRAA